MLVNNAFFYVERPGVVAKWWRYRGEKYWENKENIFFWKLKKNFHLISLNSYDDKDLKKKSYHAIVKKCYKQIYFWVFWNPLQGSAGQR